MKKLWVNVVPYKKQIAIAALESGAEAVILPDGDSEKVQQFGKIKTIEKNGQFEYLLKEAKRWRLKLQVRPLKTAV